MTPPAPARPTLVASTRAFADPRTPRPLLGPTSAGLALAGLVMAGLVMAGTAAGAMPQAVTDTLLADLNPTPGVQGSYSGGFASDGELVWFRGSDPNSQENYRLWATDGTPAGTVQLDQQALNVQDAVFADDGTLVIALDELGLDVAIWSSDGTPGGTQRLLGPQDWSTRPFDLTPFDGAVWFLAGVGGGGGGGGGVDVWTVDPGAGTVGVAFSAPTAATSLFASDGHLFVADAGGTRLWSSDGTAGSLTQVGTFPTADSGSFDHTAHVGDTAVFDIGGFGSSGAWWSSDGTAAGTRLLTTTGNIWWSVEADTKVYLTAGPQIGLPTLWETDGTPAGTLPVNIGGTTDGQRVGPFDAGTTVGDELFYGGLVAGAGFEVCRTAGAAAGGTLVADIRTGPADSTPNDFVVFDGALYFRAEDGVTGREVWQLDPTTNATTLVADLFPGPGAGIVGASPTLMAAQHGVVWGQSFPEGIEPAVTDGTTTGLLLDIGNDGIVGGSQPRHFVRLGDHALFAADDGAHGVELWITDGTEPGTQLLVDINPGAAGSEPHHLVRFGDRVFFFATHPSFGSELWFTDGTNAGTARVTDLVPGPASSEPLFSAPPVPLGDALYFIAREPNNDFALFRTDGSQLGTTKVITTDPTGFVAEFVRLVRVGERLVFPANLGGGLELWTSDGTAAGSELLVEMTPDGSTFFSQLVSGDTIGYVTASVDGAQTLWRTDGTPAGTELLLSEPSGFLFGPSGLATQGDTLFFTTETPADGREPWISDGTVAGTQLLADIAPGPASSRALSFTPAGDRVYFAVESPPGSSHFQQVWSTDGSSGGTALVVELPSPIAGAGVADFWAPGDDGSLVFSNVDGNGSEWWVTDGTAGGTRALADSALGPAFGNPSAGVLLRDTLLFAATDGATGIELHAMPFVETDGWAVTTVGSGCVGANGTPTLSLGAGEVAVGQAFVLDLDQALPGTSVLWAFGLQSGGPAAIGECALQLPVPTLLGATLADGLGSTALPLAIPGAASLAGLVVDFQAFSTEPGGPFQGLGALSDVVQIVIGP